MALIYNESPENITFPAGTPLGMKKTFREAFAYNIPYVRKGIEESYPNIKLDIDIASMVELKSVMTNDKSSTFAGKNGFEVACHWIKDSNRPSRFFSEILTNLFKDVDCKEAFESNVKRVFFSFVQDSSQGDNSDYGYSYEIRNSSDLFVIVTRNWAAFEQWYSIMYQARSESDEAKKIVQVLESL